MLESNQKVKTNLNATFTERREVILGMLVEDRSVGISDLAKRLGVTMVTARADLAALEDEGILVRTHGGAPSGKSSI